MTHRHTRFHALAVPTAVLLISTLLGATAVQARRCTTMDVLRERRNSLVNATANSIQARPWAELRDVIELSGIPVRIHYDGEIFLPAAQQVAAAMEIAWQSQVVEQGYPAPLPDDGRGGDDRLDIYLTGTGSAEAVTLVDDDADPNDGRQASPVHLRLNPGSPILTSLVHHEFQHALQFAIDASETVMFFESTAVLQELFALRAEDDAWQDNIDFFQDYPQAPPFADGVQWGRVLGAPNLIEYGAVLLPLYIDEVYGEGDGVLIREIWEASSQADDIEINEPDWMDALQDVTGIALRDMILDFATWRALVGPLASDDRGPSVADLMTGEELVAVRPITGNALRGFSVGGTSEFGAPHQLGCVNVQVRAEQGQAEEVEVQADSRADPPAPLGVSWVVRDPATGDVMSGISSVGSEVVELISIPEGWTMIAAVCDQSSPDAEDDPIANPVQIRVWNTRLPFGPVMIDAGPRPDPEPTPDVVVDGGPNVQPPICGCQQANARGQPSAKEGPFAEAKRLLFPVLFAVGAISLIIRSRRASRRRRSYQGSGFAKGIKRHEFGSDA